MTATASTDTGAEGGAAGQLDLFGGPTTPTETPAPAPAPGESNDLDLIRDVTGNACRGLYLLVGAADRVYARAEGPDTTTVVRVPRYEEDAVHQLLRRRWLTLGGAHHGLTCGAASLTGTAVLAPKATRARVARWEHLARPPSWEQPPGPGRRR